jgi:ribokinase
MQDLCFYTPQFPRPGETVVGRFESGGGGKGSNQAVAAARAGASVGLIGAVGDDGFGQTALERWQAEGVETRVAIKSGTPTGTAGISINGAGENTIIIAGGANDALSAEDLDREWLSSASLVGGQLESAPDATLEAFRLARAGGATTLFNPAPMRDVLDPALLSVTDILILNESEFAELLKLQRVAEIDPATVSELSAERLRDLADGFGVPTVILTLGGRGGFLRTAARAEFFPALSGVEVVDTTGAGDAFIGGFAAGWLRSKGSLDVALRWGSTTAGLSVTKPGTARAMPTQAEIEARLAVVS